MKRILFISPSFFGYDRDIIAELNNQGFDVVHYDERSSKKKIFKAFIKINPLLVYPISFFRYIKILKEIDNEIFDKILIIKAESIPSFFLKNIQKKFKNKSTICLYLWDSMKNIKGIKRKLKYFDKVLTFDRKDSIQYPNLIFLPLFYTSDFENSMDNNDYNTDFLFVGTVHSDRYELLQKIKDDLSKRKMTVNFIYYYPSKIILKMLKLTGLKFKNANINDFIFKPLSKQDIRELMLKSRIILDVNHPQQVGLTMRSIESIGMNKKLITTNRDIINYDFFMSNNVLVLDRNSLIIEHDFYQAQYERLNQSVYLKYSLKSWIKTILEV